MTKTTKKTQTASRPPVDALHYEKLALSAFGACDRQIRQLETLINLAASITRCPATTVEERRRERNLLEHLLYTVEQYQQEVECEFVHQARYRHKAVADLCGYIFVTNQHFLH